MQWAMVRKIPLDSLKFIAQREARTLNRRIYELGQFRAGVDANTITLPAGKPGELIDEAYRRELILRHDIIRFLTGEGLPPGDHVELMNAARKFLDDRGTHTSHHRRS